MGCEHLLSGNSRVSTVLLSSEGVGPLFVLVRSKLLLGDLSGSSRRWILMLRIYASCSLFVVAVSLLLTTPSTVIGSASSLLRFARRRSSRASLRSQVRRTEG